MKNIFTILLLFVTLHQIQAQERTISGRLTSSDDGAPLPGVSITIKGTSVGTVTDSDGNYSIKAPVGATLVFAFVGMKSREVFVTEDNLQSPKPDVKRKQAKSKKVTQALAFMWENDEVGQGVAKLHDATPSYHNKGVLDPTTIKSIVKTSDKVVIRTYNDPVKTRGFGLQFSSSFGIEELTKLPSFQSEYSQGRPVAGELRWRGADQQEIFSWGPSRRILEYDGSIYDYDKRGMLVAVGSGNGKGAQAYDARAFFRNGSGTVNELIITLPTAKGGALVFDAERRSRSGAIPNSSYNRTNLSGHLKNFNLSNELTMNASVLLNDSRGYLLNRGANISTIIGSVYRTPATFDNSNDLSRRHAVRSEQSYRLPDGNRRTHAPGSTDNPFGLVNEIPDEETTERLVGTLNFRYTPRPSFDITFNGNVDHQRGTTIFGLPRSYAGYPGGRFTERNENEALVSSIVTPSFSFDHAEGEFKVSLSYQTQYLQRMLDRRDAFNFPDPTAFGRIPGGDSVVSVHRSLSRATHEIIVNARYARQEWLNLWVSNRNYFSSTINPASFTNLFPSASLTIDVARLLELWSIDNLKLYGSIARTLRETPLIYNSWAYGSTRMPVESYAAFYESSELLLNQSILPETERKFETGVKFNPFYHVAVEFAYFNNRTEDFISPVWNSTAFVLDNVATIKNYGTNISASYYHYRYDADWGTTLKWTRQNSVALNLYGSEGIIPLSGFASAQTVLAHGQPFGSIYGSSYMRNSAGDMIIGADGFPIKNDRNKIIGNALPDWTLGWASQIRLKKFKLSLLLDFRKGGEVWNGTRAALDYLGRSSESGELRNISNFIFEGVDANGNRNSIPVVFATHSKSVDENRWVRYGLDGVAEDYIEDASWIRLNEVVLSYSIRRTSSPGGIRDISLSLTGRNLFLITPYTGVDPATGLFGYGEGTGLDLFNSPATRSYSAQITLKI